MPDNDIDFFGMSDDDFAKSQPQSTVADEEGDDTPSSSGSENDNSGDNNGDNAADNGNDAQPDDAGDDQPPAGDDKDAEPKADAGAKPKEDEPSKDKPEAAPKPEAKPQASAPVKDAAPVLSSKDVAPEALASFYDQVMAPIRANGKTIQLRSPEEAIRLMQMGAGYAKKVQDMQPHVKTLRMLERNNLLNEDELSYLIDLRNKNPEAIKKLIKDSGIDPLDINEADNASYRPTNYSVSEEEVNFEDTLREVAELPGGRDTIALFNKEFDEQSKQAVFAHPELIRIIQTQRDNGLFDQITSEMERMKVLGEIKPRTPYLEAYKIAGDHLASQNRLVLGSNETGTSQPKAPGNPAQGNPVQPAGKVLGTRTAAPKSAAPNASDKARAAAPPQSSSRKAKEIVNPLDMADDEFLKQMRL